MKKLTLIAAISMVFSAPAHAWFFFVPIPNLAKPADLQRLIDTLEKSDETKAMAYVSEDKAFGSKYWAWGHHVGISTQKDADELALAKCQAMLDRLKARTEGGKAVYDFGTKKCELHDFQNKTVKLPPPPPPVQPAAPEPQQAADSPVAKKLRELDQLKKDGLITEDEYSEKRKAIISAI